MARLLRTEGEYTSDLMEAAARLEASPRSTRRSTAAASRRAKNAARSAASRLAIRRLGGWPGGGRGAGTWPRFFDGGGGMVAVATGEGGVLGVLVLRCGGLGNLGEVGHPCFCFGPVISTTTIDYYMIFYFIFETGFYIKKQIKCSHSPFTSANFYH